MSELMLNQIQHILTTVSDSVQDMGDKSSSDMETILGALDDMAANMLATQAVVAVLAQKYPVELADVEAWLKKDLAGTGGPSPAALGVASYLVSGNKA